LVRSLQAAVIDRLAWRPKIFYKANKGTETSSLISMNHALAPNNFCARSAGPNLSALDIMNSQPTRGDKRQRIKIVPTKFIIIRGETQLVRDISNRLALSERISPIRKTS
tara:strand:- start:2107 stop:2436 length:330 start_codon:yes stop_codon:yes gene_type:complete